MRLIEEKEFETLQHARATAADDVLRRLVALTGPQFHDHEIIHEPFLTERQLDQAITTIKKEFGC